MWKLLNTETVRVNPHEPEYYESGPANDMALIRVGYWEITTWLRPRHEVFRCFGHMRREPDETELSCERCCLGQANQYKQIRTAGIRNQYWLVAALPTNPHASYSTNLNLIRIILPTASPTSSERVHQHKGQKHHNSCSIMGNKSLSGIHNGSVRAIGWGVI